MDKASGARPDKVSLKAAVSAAEQADKQYQYVADVDEEWLKEMSEESAMKLIIQAELERYQAQETLVSESLEESEE